MITFSFNQIMALVTEDQLPTGYKVDKNNLLALLQSSTSVAEKVLAAKCFNRSDLLQIVNNSDSLRSMHYQTIRFLYFYFNPKREWKTSETPNLEMYYMFSRTEHVLGLTDTLAFEAMSKKYNLYSDGEFLSISLQHMTEYLRLFRDKFPSETTDQITAAYEHTLSFIVPCHNKYKPNAANDFYERYKKNELTYISTGWNRHAVGLTFYGDYLVYTNRGSAGHPHYGASIFKIKNKSLITKELFTKFIASDNIPTPKAFQDILEKIVDFKRPVVRFRCKKQRHPTCSFANSKSNIEPLFVLTKAGPFATSDELQECYNIEYKRKKYKFFTNFIRDREIDEIIKSMFYAKNIELIYFYASLAKKFIREHHGKERGFIKDREEIKRAYDFYERIPNNIRKVMDNDHDFVELMRELHVKNKPFAPKSPYYLWPQTHFIRSGGHYYRVNTEKGCIVAINHNETPKMHFSYKQAKLLIRTFG